MLDLESEVHERSGLGSILTVGGGGVTFFTGIFYFHVAKPLMPMLTLLPIVCIYGKTRFYEKVTDLDMQQMPRRSRKFGGELYLKKLYSHQQREKEII